MSKVVRSSKFRHVFGTAAKREHSYDGVKVSRSAWDSNKIKVNTKFVAAIWEASGGGAFACMNHEATGKIPATLPLICGHKAEILDVDFSPFNEHLVASASEDSYVKIWQIPEGGLKSNMTDPVQSLQGHRRKVGTTDFNPIASNILATSSSDLEVKLWDIEKGVASLTVTGHADLIQGLAWNHNGNEFATASKDKKIRIVDPRANKIVGEKEAHQGIKGSRVIYLGNTNKMLTIGFSKTSERQYSLWDPRSFSEPIQNENIDTSAGILMPFYDNDTKVLYLAGKGDGNIRYYEVTDDPKPIYYLTEFKSATPQRGVAQLPKRAVNVSECEIARLYKISGDGKLIEPISFQVPRRSDLFQDDLYPDCFSGEASLSSSEWLSGRDGTPRTTSLRDGFVAKPAAEFKPVVQEIKDTGPKNEKELRDEYEKLKSRVAYLEAELVKKDARIKQLEGGN